MIGADGRASRVAKAVQARSYEEKPRLQWPFYTYFSELPVDGFETYIRPFRGFAAAATNDGLTMLVVGWPYAEAHSYKADVEGNYYRTLELVPQFASRVKAAKREAPFLGGAVPNYLRVPFGPGWALVGDAGYTKDPITAQGITDAFRDAEQCSAAVDHWLSGPDVARRRVPRMASGAGPEGSSDVSVHDPAGYAAAAATGDAAIARCHSGATSRRWTTSSASMQGRSLLRSSFLLSTLPGLLKQLPSRS